MFVSTLYSLEGRWVLTKTRGRAILYVKIFSCLSVYYVVQKAGKLGNEITSGVSLLKLSNVDVHWGKLKREI